MSKRIIYIDEFGNKVDVNSIKGIHIIFNDIFTTCEENYSCLCVKENIKTSVENVVRLDYMKLKTRKL